MSYRASLCCVLLASACVGNLGEGGRTGNAPGACIDGELPEVRNLRLTRTHYVNALTEAFGPDVVRMASSALDSLPTSRTGRFYSELPPPNYSEVEAYLGVASAIGYGIGDDGARLAALDACLSGLSGTVSPASDPCLGGLVDRLGRSLLRRTLTADERSRFLDAYTIGGSTSVGEGVATMLTTMLIDPAFLYFLELNGTEVEPGVLELTPHELAARLARVLWSSVPDDALLDAADAGLDDDQLIAEVERMWADPRAHAAMGQFYTDWLQLGSLPYASSAIAADAATRDALREDMRAEVVAFTEAITFEREGSYRDLLLDRTTFIETDILASIYGLPAGTRGEAMLPEGRRAGLLTRAAWLATIEIPRSNAGHLIKRGAHLASFVCRDLPPPDPNLFPSEDPADPGTGAPRTLRDRFLAATGEPACARCHRTLDGLGALFGHYGAAGEWIDAERVATDGAPVDLAIDTMGLLPFGAREVPLSDAVGLSEALVDGRDGVNCFASQLSRSMLARAPGRGDACLVTRATDVLRSPDAEPGSLREAIFTMLMSTEWRRARLP